MKEDIKLKYVTKDEKIEIISNTKISNIDDYIEYHFLNDDKLVLEKIDNNSYYLYPSLGFQKDNLYHIIIKDKNISFKSTKKKELLLKIKSDDIKLPKYWKKYLDDKIPSLIDKTKNNDFNFILFSDVHINTNRLKFAAIIKYLIDKVRVDEVICNGDVITSYDTLIKAYDELIKFKELTKGIKYLYVYGNHDSNAKDYSKDENVVKLNNFKYLIINNDKIKYEKNKMYGVYDIDDKKIRIIVLDTGACKVSNLDEEELEYFKSKLLERSDYNILIFAHRIFAGTELYELNPNIFIHESGKKIKDAIDEVYDKMTSSIISIFSGHNHIDCMDENSKYNNIARTCDAGDRNSLFDANYQYRDKQTTKEQAIDYVSINTKLRTIDVIRIGCGDALSDLSIKY